MTKKSQARLDRDAAEKQQAELAKQEQQLLSEVDMPNNNWEGLNQQHNIHSQLFKGYHEMVELLVTPPIMQNLENIKETTNLVKSLASDTKMLKEKTERVYNQHKDKTGPATSVDDNFEIIKVFQEYEGLLDSHQLLCTPVAMQLNEHLVTAIGKLEASQPQEPVPVAPPMAALISDAIAHRAEEQPAA